MSTAGASFSVRFVRNGDQIVITRDVVNSAGQGAALFQVVDSKSGTPIPDWTVAANQPIIRIGIRSSAGYPVEMTGVVWKYNGTAITFASAFTTSWQTCTNHDASFQGRINTINGREYYELKIIKNLATATTIANRQIDYAVSYASNGLTDTIDGSAEIIIQAGGASSHILQITADRVEIDATNSTATLTAVGMYGSEAITIGQNGYTIKWYNNGVEISGQTAATLTVTRSMVEGGNLFQATLFLNNNPVAYDSQRINDIADEYQIVCTPKTGTGYEGNTGYLAPGQNAYWAVKLYRNNAQYAGTINYTWKVFNALNVQTGTGSGTATSGADYIVTVTPSMAVVGEGSGSYYADCDIVITAEF
jgi:hypothetical protein